MTHCLPFDAERIGNRSRSGRLLRGRCLPYRFAPFVLASLLFAVTAGNALAELRVSRPRCEYLVDPTAVDAARPRLFWVVESSRRGERQTAYQIRAASSLAALRAGKADLWDSGKVASSETTHIPYAGKPLDSGRECWWQARAWDRDGKASPYGPPARWRRGLTRPSDWKARWIGFDLDAPSPLNGQPAPVPEKGQPALPPAPLLRQEFGLPVAPREAILYVTALGLVEMRLNGRRVGEDLLAPGWTDYRKRVYYRAYDVTGMLRAGRNAIGAILGDGWAVGTVGLGGRTRYGIPKPRLLAQIVVRYDDGSRATIGTDGRWKGSDGPILEGDLLMGETYDARREKRGWDRPGYAAEGWRPVVVHPDWKGKVEAHPGVPVRRMRLLAAKKVTEPRPGAFVFDMGQNMVGWAKIRAKGPAGTRIRLRFAEMLNPDGTIYTTNLRGARNVDTWFLRGDPAGEEWEPRFTFHGFRYVEVTGVPGRPALDSVTGVVIHSATPQSGSFACSSPMVNRLQSNIEWGQRGNFLEVPTDCPQRDERLGWTGDAQAFVRTAAYNMDVASFFKKWMIDVEDAQRGGAFTDVAPDVCCGAGTAAWGDAGVIVPWTIYRVYGDKSIIFRHYDAMARWIAYLESTAPGLLRPAQGYGDWLSIAADTPKDVLATAYFAYSTGLLARMARAIGREADARKYEALRGRIVEAFNAAYVDADGKIKGDTQTVYVLALWMDLLPERLRASAAKRLVEAIEAKQGHLSTGFVGTAYLNPTLTKAGNTAAAYRLLNNDTFPSWGFTIKHGATTIWERWDGWTPERGFQDPGMNSFNHYSFGAVGEWLYRTVAGIDTDPETPGFRRIVIAPEPGGGLTSARGVVNTIRGRIASDWRVKGSDLMLSIEVPANVAATVRVPSSGRDRVTEGGRPAAKGVGVTWLRDEKGASVYRVGSGRYSFLSKRFR